jgi:hypothetical protein
MVAAGLGPDVVVAKIRSSAGAFDTRPETLGSLKAKGVPDAVLMSMIEAGRREPSPPAPSAADMATVVLDVPGGDAAGTSRPSSTEDPRTTGLARKLREGLLAKGVFVAPRLDDRPCCSLSIDLLGGELKSATFMGQMRRYVVRATLTLRNAAGRVLYTRELEGEDARRIGPFGTRTPGPDRAITDLVEKALNDGVLLRHIQTGT